MTVSLYVGCVGESDKMLSLSFFVCLRTWDAFYMLNPCCGCSRRRVTDPLCTGRVGEQEQTLSCLPLVVSLCLHFVSEARSDVEASALKVTIPICAGQIDRTVCYLLVPVPVLQLYVRDIRAHVRKHIHY